MPGFGIINPPASSEKDVIKYNKEQTICYEIKSGGQQGDKIHYFFFSRMSCGAVKFLIKESEAISKLQQSDNFKKASFRKKKEKLNPYIQTDLLELQFENLIFMDNDNQTGTLKIKRKDMKIQKDYFSAAEYLVYGVNQVYENDYYKKANRKANRILDAFMVN